MRSEHKLIVRATVIKHIKEEYVLDCTGMTMDEWRDEEGVAHTKTDEYRRLW